MSSIASLGYIYNLPFTKLAILDNGTNKKQAIFTLSIKILQFIMEKEFQIPTPEAIESLIGKGLYQIWNALCLLIEHKYEMERLWNNVGENGNMNISIEEVEKLSVLYTLKKIPLALWLY